MLVELVQRGQPGHGLLTNGEGALRYAFRFASLGTFGCCKIKLRR